MSTAADPPQPGNSSDQQPRRSREEIVREIKLALTIGDGLLLEAERERARGFDPYDNRLGSRPREVWKAGRRV